MQNNHINLKKTIAQIATTKSFFRDLQPTLLNLSEKIPLIENILLQLNKILPQILNLHQGLGKTLGNITTIKNNLQMASSDTEHTTNQILDNIEKAMEELEAQGTLLENISFKDNKNVQEALKINNCLNEYLFNIMNMLQFQDILSQKLASIESTFALYNDIIKLLKLFGIEIEEIKDTDKAFNKKIFDSRPEKLSNEDINNIIDNLK